MTAALTPGAPSTDRLKQGHHRWLGAALQGVVGLDLKLGRYATHLDARYVSRYLDYQLSLQGGNLANNNHLGNFWALRPERDL